LVGQNLRFNGLAKWYRNIRTGNPLYWCLQIAKAVFRDDARKLSRVSTAAMGIIKQDNSARLPNRCGEAGPVKG
tara:strand:- start:22 stop:243 length:222 start_codon:yes stop_codon:yes gene_type:complete